jgi:dTDP-4-amino-4,6-dideoxygalactose transaminase
MKVPFVDLAAQYRSIKPQVQSAINGVLDRNDYILGNDVAAFEKEFAKWTGAAHAVGCASGTDALILALRACGIGPGDEVITTPYTWISTVLAVTLVGAKPVFADINPATYNIDPAQIAKRITRRTKAILPVHIYGQSAAMDEIGDIAKKYKLLVIEDAAQSHGSYWRGLRVGQTGIVTCYSFYPGKNIGAYGDAGGVTTPDAKIARTLRMLRVMGQETKHKHEIIGYNSRLDTMQAAILRVKLKHLEDWTETRRKAAQRYHRMLKDLKNVVAPKEADGVRHVFHVYAVQVPRRDAVAKTLNADGVSAQVHYPTPVHLQPCYKSLGYKRGSMPVAEKVCSRILSLPMYPEITEAQQAYVVDRLRAALGK